MLRERSAGAVGAAHLREIDGGRFPLSLWNVLDHQVPMVTLAQAVELHAQRIGSLEPVAEAQPRVLAHWRAQARD